MVRIGFGVNKSDYLKLQEQYWECQAKVLAGNRLKPFPHKALTDVFSVLCETLHNKGNTAH